MKNKIVENVFFGIFAKKSVTPIGHYLTWLGHAYVYPCYNVKCTKSRALCSTVILLCYRPGKVCNPKSDPRTIKAPVENRHLFCSDQLLVKQVAGCAANRCPGD